MQPKYEAGKKFENNSEPTQKGVKEYLESKGYFMYILEQDSNSFRFQIWKDPAGLPLTMNEGLNDFIETMKSDFKTIEGYKDMRQEYLLDGVVHLIVELDKSN